MREVIIQLISKCSKLFRLMMLLDNDKLSALEEEFKEYPNGIELINFIFLMKSAINHSSNDKYDLMNGLIKLF